MRKFNEAAGMPVPASVKAGKLLSWRTAAKIYKALSRSKKMDDNCCRSEKNSYLCDALHLIQATRFANFKPLAFFVPSGNDIVPTPVRSVNAPAACFRCCNSHNTPPSINPLIAIAEINNNRYFV